jgi:hypothetical protein
VAAGKRLEGLREAWAQANFQTGIFALASTRETPSGKIGHHGGHVY